LLVHLSGRKWHLADIVASAHAPLSKAKPASLGIVLICATIFAVAILDAISGQPDMRKMRQDRTNNAERYFRSNFAVAHNR